MRSLDLYRWLACLRHPGLWPLFGIPTHLTSRERATLMQLARRQEQQLGRAIRIVEIGSYLGASSAFMAAGLRDPGSRVMCIDTWTNEAMTEGRRDTLPAFTANTSSFRDRIVPVRGWSHDPAVIEAVRNAGDVDLLFIDGDHSHAGAKADWENYSPMLAPGAIVVFHDIGWADGVKRVVDELARPTTRREHALPNLWWGQRP